MQTEAQTPPYAGAPGAPPVHFSFAALRGTMSQKQNPQNAKKRPQQESLRKAIERLKALTQPFASQTF
jgi:hypothetical protein